MARHLADSSTQPARESWSSRALKIAAKYLEDPQKWAAQDKFGKGLTVCLRRMPMGGIRGIFNLFFILKLFTLNRHECSLPVLVTC